MHITGIAFKVCGVVQGLRELPTPHPVVKVTTPQPRLVPSLIDWPDHEGSLLIGQLHRCTLRLFNAGKTPLKNLAVTTSHPHFLVCDLINDDALIQTLLTTTVRKKKKRGEFSVTTPNPKIEYFFPSSLSLSIFFSYILILKTLVYINFIKINKIYPKRTESTCKFSNGKCFV